MLFNSCKATLPIFTLPVKGKPAVYYVVMRLKNLIIYKSMPQGFFFLLSFLLFHANLTVITIFLLLLNNDTFIRL